MARLRRLALAVASVGLALGAQMSTTPSFGGLGRRAPPPNAEDHGSAEDLSESGGGSEVATGGQPYEPHTIAKGVQADDEKSAITSISPVKHATALEHVGIGPKEHGTTTKQAGAKTLSASLTINFGIAAVAISPSHGGRLFVVGRDGSAKLWSARTHKIEAGGFPPQPGLDASGQRGAAAFSPDGQKAATCSGNRCTLWSLHGPLREIGSFTERSKVASLVWSPGGDRVLASFSGYRTIGPDEEPYPDQPYASVWDVETSGRMHLIADESDPEHDNGKPAGETDSGDVYDYALISGLRSKYGVFSVPTDTHERVFSALFCHGGERILTGTMHVGGSFQVQEWSATTGERIRTVDFHGPPECEQRYDGKVAVLSPSGQVFVTCPAGKSQVVAVFDARTREVIRRASVAHTSISTASAFLLGRGGERVLTASKQGGMKLWEASTGQVIASLAGHTDHVVSAKLSPGGNRILTASDDHTAKLWDAATGELLATLKGHTGRVSSAVFLPNGTHAFTHSWDSTAKLWMLPK